MLIGLVLLPLLGAVAVAAPKVVVSKRFTFVLPEGYADVSDRRDEPGFIMLEAQRPSRGHRPAMVIQKNPSAGGSREDSAACSKMGDLIAHALAGKLKSAPVVPGPLGKTCQMHIITPQDVVLITELNVMHAGILEETWLMTCNHAVGDNAAEKVCKETLARLKLTE